MVLILILGGGPVVTSGFFWAFIDIPTILFVFGVPFGLLLFSYEKELLVFIWCSILVLCGRKTHKSERMAEVARMGWRYVLAASLICCMKNCVIILQDLSDPSKIGVGMAVAMLPFIYAVMVMYFVFMPLEVAFKVKEERAALSYTPPSVTNLLLRTLQLFTIVLSFFILLNVLA